MRGGKEEKNQMSPMFPRLHVNDAEKGGPRAPPRNKMALYEQLSVPSQRVGTGGGSGPSLPLLRKSGNSFVPSTSSSNGASHRYDLFLPPCDSSATSNLPQDTQNHCIPGIKFNSMMELYKSPHHRTPNETAEAPVSSHSKFDLFQTNFAHFKRTLTRNIGGVTERTCNAASVSPELIPPGDIQQSKSQKPDLSLNMKFPWQSQTYHEKHTNAGPINLKSIQRSRTQYQDNLKMCLMTPNLDASLSLQGAERNSKCLKKPHTTLHQGCKTSADKSNMTQGKDSHSATREAINMREGILSEKSQDAARGISFQPRGEMSTLQLNEGHMTSSNKLEEDSKCDGDSGNGSKPDQPRNDDNDKHNNVDEKSPDSISTSVLSPDEVVEAIGEKEFWKARNAIVNQQRVFALQVFELHRIVKVQKLIARSPHLLLEESLSFRKPSVEAFPVKKPRTQYVLEPTPLFSEIKENSQRSNINPETANGNTIGKLPLPSINSHTKAFLGQHQRPQSERPQPESAANSSRSASWWFPPPGNQWLVPVVSPSEGLVYKPYTGPGPPTTGFVAPIYGGCSPMDLSSVAGEFLNTAVGVPASHQVPGNVHGMSPLGLSYFPTYGTPLMNSSISSSAVEQPNYLDKSRLCGWDNQFSAVKCNMSTQGSQVISPRLHRNQTSKESETQGSTASSPPQRIRGDVLPLFPVAPSTEHKAEASGNDQQTRVIKVVPHNPRLATESAARIFRSIQEERKQYD